MTWLLLSTRLRCCCALNGLHSDALSTFGIIVIIVIIMTTVCWNGSNSLAPALMQFGTADCWNKKVRNTPKSVRFVIKSTPIYCKDVSISDSVCKNKIHRFPTPFLIKHPWNSLFFQAEFWIASCRLTQTSVSLLQSGRALMLDSKALPTIYTYIFLFLSFQFTCSPAVWDGRRRGGESGGCPVLLLHLWRRGGRLPRPGPTQQEEPQPEHVVGRQLLGVQVGGGMARKSSCPELMGTRLVSWRDDTGAFLVFHSIIIRVTANSLIRLV